MAASIEPPLTEAEQRPADTAAPSRDDLIHAYRVMYMSRRLDDREISVRREKRICFQISCGGHEAVEAAAGLVLRAGHDWFYPYYRDRVLCLMLGMTAEEMLLGSVGAASDPSSGGRQMPSHWSDPQRHIVTGSSPTATQWLYAVGCSQASRYMNPESDEVTLAIGGEGSTIGGGCWDAVRAAVLESHPVTGP